MNPIVKKDILNVLQETIGIVRQGDLFRLREVSDHVIHNATTFQDKDSLGIAVIIYSLSKVYKSKVDKFILPRLEKAFKYLSSGDIIKYETEVKGLIKDISQRDEKSNVYVQEVFERAQIKKASRIFEHGISMGQVADTLGISLWELMDYVGKTKIFDQFQYQTNIKQKLDYTRKIFTK